MLASGFTVKEIAHGLNVSVKTAEAHRYNLMRKLGISKAVLLAHLAIGCGFVDPIVPVRFQPERGPLVARQGAD